MENKRTSNCVEICIPKKVEIKGTNNRYQVKKLLDKKEKKQRMQSIKWNGLNINMHNDTELLYLKCMLNNDLSYLNELDNYNNDTSNDTTIINIIQTQIKQKILGYRRQDILSKLLNNEKFINYETIVQTMIDTKLLCYYCNCRMLTLYTFPRDMKQWTVDRIDNDVGHNLDNFYLSCLECNLQRRKQDSDKFLFTKQLKITKLDEPNVDEHKLDNPNRVELKLDELELDELELDELDESDELDD
jgi:hypothetical protein